MSTGIIINCGDYGINVFKIVKRILRYAPTESTEGLNEIVILDSDPRGKNFARYLKNEQKIELYINDIISWQPWILRKSFIFPYLTIGIALGHEIDHHVHRHDNGSRREESAQKNAFKYIYPSLGFFKPLARFLHFLLRQKKGITTQKAR